MDEETTLNILFTGDFGVGKTSLIKRYAEGTFNPEFTPTVLEYSETITKEGETFKYTLWDTPVGEYYVRLRTLAYPGTHVFILCFDINNQTTYDNIKSLWVPEIRHHVRKTPFLLVGTKIDIRHQFEITYESRLSEENDPFTVEDGEALAKSIGAVKYCECSSLTGKGVKELLDIAIEVAHTYKFSTKTDDRK